jgi:peptidoglycan/xylan/chitin deacetylase (PgdA/CDA1 family)
MTAAMSRASQLAKRCVNGLERRVPQRLGIVAYHRVSQSDRGSDPWNLCVDEAVFDEQLATLRRVGAVVPLHVAIQAAPWRRTVARRPRFAITFDDGYVDNLHTAVAALERHDVSATVFVATGLVDRDAFWWDVLADLVFSSGASPDHLRDSAVRADVLSGDESPASDHLHALHDRIYWSLVERSIERIDDALSALADDVGVPSPRPAQRPMTTDELSRLAAHPLVTIGAHTVTHPRLTCLSPDAIRREIVTCNRRLDELFGPHERVFAYPYGNTNAAVAAIARSCGFRHAVTTDPRWVAIRDEPMLIPRLDPSGDIGIAGWTRGAR